MSTPAERLPELALSRLRRDSSGQHAFVLTFEFDGFVVVTMRIELDDKQTGAQLVITNMTTFPESVRGKGYGTKALRSLLVWAQASKVENIQAVQVQELSERFWFKNHFYKIGNVTNDFQYLPKP